MEKHIVRVEPYNFSGNLKSADIFLKSCTAFILTFVVVKKDYLSMNDESPF